MCGIFGYIGNKNASDEIWHGLKRLEYRGYDSWGVAVVEKNKIKVSKKIGALGELEELKHLPYSNIGIGHTRWATHGGVSELNAHPHYSTDESFVLAQNGIVENYQDLKKELQSKGHKFETQTDTEIIVRLVEEKLKTSKSLREAVREAFLDLHGRNTIIILSSKGDQVVAVRNGSPLVAGMGALDSHGKPEEFFFASDTLSFANKTDQVLYINDYEMIQYYQGEIELYNVKTDEKLPVRITTLDHDDVTIDKEGYDHFMIKEIVEQKHTIREAIQYTQEELQPIVDDIKTASTVYTIGAGTASFAASQVAYFLREFASIKAIELKSYEIGSYKNLFTPDDLVIAVSQSGETADTIEALEIAQSKGAKIASLVNMLGSTITRMSIHKYFSRSGPEICVASTKAFTSQIAWGYLLAKTVAGDYVDAVENIRKITENLDTYFNEDNFSKIKDLVKKLVDKEHFFVLGKGQNFSIALEGALKIKEITYKHFEGFAAGELKHGVIALVEEGTPVFVIVSNDGNKNDLISAAAEVKARGAYVIAIAKENNELFDDFIETFDAKDADSILNVIPFQLISYFLGIELGHSPDKPRNLAKSVTVK